MARCLPSHPLSMTFTSKHQITMLRIAVLMQAERSVVHDGMTFGEQTKNVVQYYNTREAKTDSDILESTN